MKRSKLSRALTAPLLAAIAISLACPAPRAAASFNCGEVFSLRESSGLSPELEYLAAIVEESDEVSDFPQALRDSSKRSRAKLGRIFKRVIKQGSFSEKEMERIVESTISTVFPESRSLYVRRFASLLRLLTPTRYRANLVVDLAFHNSLRDRIRKGLADIGIEERPSWLGSLLNQLREHPETVDQESTVVISHFLEMIPMFSTITGVSSERVMRALADSSPEELTGKPTTDRDLLDALDKDPDALSRKPIDNSRRLGWRLPYLVTTLSRSILSMAYSIAIYFGAVNTYETGMLAAASHRVMNVTESELQSYSATLSDQQLRDRNLKTWIESRERILGRKFDPERIADDRQWLQDREEDLKDVSILREFGGE